MRVANIIVFDEALTSSVAVVFTADPLHKQLGSFDQLAIMAVVDNVGSPGGAFKIQVFHSADGRLWLPKSGVDGNAELGGIAGYTLSSGSQRGYFGADHGTTPSLGLIRLKVDLGTSARAHVRVHVTGRNKGSFDGSQARAGHRGGVR